MTTQSIQLFQVSTWRPRHQNKFPFSASIYFALSCAPPPTLPILRGLANIVCIPYLPEGRPSSYSPRLPGGRPYHYDITHIYRMQGMSYFLHRRQSGSHDIAYAERNMKWTGNPP